MKDKMDNVINLFDKDNTDIDIQKSIFKTINEAIKDIEEFKIVNCMIIMVDDEDVITYSYSNFNRSVTMVGALETLKHIFITRDNNEEE